MDPRRGAEQCGVYGSEADIGRVPTNVSFGPGEDAWWASARSSGSTADHPTSLGRCGANAAVSHKNTPDPPFYDWWPICPGACCRWRLSPRNGSYGGNHAKTQLVTRKFARRRGPDLRLCSPFDFGRGRRACKHDAPARELTAAATLFWPQDVRPVSDVCFVICAYNRAAALATGAGAMIGV